MSSGGTVLASGVQVSLDYVRECVRGTTPIGLETPTDPIAADKTGAAANQLDFTDAGNAFITNGYAVGQTVTTTGFADTDLNGNWRVAAVTAGTLSVEDPGDLLGADEVSGAGQAIEIRLLKLRSTSRNVNLQKDTLESEEVRASGQISDSRHGFNRVVGSPGFQLSRQDYDDIIENAMGQYWDFGPTDVSGVDLGVTQGAPSSDTATIDRASGSFLDDGYRPGDIITTAGFSTGANNRTKVRITVVTALVITVADIGNLMITEAAAAARTITYPGRRIDVSTLILTMTLQRGFADIGQYQKFLGTGVNQWVNSVQPTAIVGGSWDLVGMSSPAWYTSPIGNSAVVAASTNSPFAAFDGTIFEGGGLIAVATGVDWTLNRNLSGEPVIGSKFTPDLFLGNIIVTGQFTAFFLDQVLVNKFVNETESTMWYRLDDTNGTDFMSVTFPRMKYNGADMDPPAQGPVPLSMPFQALESSEQGVGAGVTVATSAFIQRSNA